jgi:uridine kinase
MSPSRASCVAEVAAAIVAVESGHPTRVAIDGFHNSRAVRYVRGSDSAEGYFLDSFDYAALRRELLEPMGPNGNRKFCIALFDYRADRALETAPRVAADDAVLLFDGVFLQRPELDARVTRGTYANRYVPGQQLYMRECQPKERAGIVFDNADLERPTVRLRPRGSRG